MKRKQILFPKWLDAYLDGFAKDNHLSYCEIIRIACCVFCREEPKYAPKKFDSREEAKQFVEDMAFHCRKITETKSKKKAHHE